MHLFIPLVHTAENNVRIGTRSCWFYNNLRIYAPSEMM